MGSERQKEGGWGEEKESTCMHVQLVLGTSANISSLKRVCSAFAEVLIVSDLLCSWFINEWISGTWLCCFTSPVTASSKPHFTPSIIRPPHEGFSFLSFLIFFFPCSSSDRATASTVRQKAAYRELPLFRLQSKDPRSILCGYLWSGRYAYFFKVVHFQDR